MSIENNLILKEIKELEGVIRESPEIKVKVVLDNRRGRKRELTISLPDRLYYLEFTTDCMYKKKTFKLKKDNTVYYTEDVDEQLLTSMDNLVKVIDGEIEKRGKLVKLDTSSPGIVVYEAKIPA